MYAIKHHPTPSEEALRLSDEYDIALLNGGEPNLADYVTAETAKFFLFSHEERSNASPTSHDIPKTAA